MWEEKQNGKKNDFFYLRVYIFFLIPTRVKLLLGYSSIWYFYAFFCNSNSHPCWISRKLWAIFCFSKSTIVLCLYDFTIRYPCPRTLYLKFFSRFQSFESSRIEITKGGCSKVSNIATRFHRIFQFNFFFSLALTRKHNRKNTFNTIIKSLTPSEWDMRHSSIKNSNYRTGMSKCRKTKKTLKKLNIFFTSIRAA